jgi:hypothetical protein
MSFNMQAYPKGRGLVLMTKFGKSEKIGPSGFSFRTVRFRQFQSKAKEEAKLEDLKIQGVLKQEKGAKRHQGTKIEESQVRSRSCKNQGVSGFSQNR